MGFERLALWLVLAFSPALVGAQGVVHGKAASGASSASAALHAPAYPARSEWTVALPALAPQPKSLAAAEDKRMRVGAARDALEEGQGGGTAKLTWVAAPDGGRAAHLRVTSVGAMALRVGLALRALPEGAELRVAGTDGTVVAALGDAPFVRESLRAHGLYWTPLTEGDTQLVELWLPAAASSEPSVAVTTVSHVFVSPSRQFKSTGTASSQACEENVACVASGNPALARAASAVAKLLYVEHGASYLCTGTLVSDGDAASQVPYMLTAAHCIGSEAAASTLNTFWFFQSASCSGKEASAYKQLASGASLLFADGASDVALVRLRERAPDGAWFAGWDATPLPAGTSALTLHHPAGDVKKVSLGQAVEPVGSGGSTYTAMAWTTGSTEGGSSGSGLFTFDGAEYVLRGALRGGSASCQTSGQLDDPSNRDFYSQLQGAAPTLLRWLSSAPSPLDDYSGLWWDPDEPGWGLSIVQTPDNRVFAAWFTYDASGQPTWMAMPHATWKGVGTLEGPIYRTQGSAYDARYDASLFAAAAAGTLRIDFALDGSATATFEVQGRSIVKALRRQPI